jgi:hypothetical protein
VENTEFKYVCEVNTERGEPVMCKLEEIRGKRPRRVTDMREVFDDKDVDGVVIATPEHWRALATVWACQAGKDVYVEKNPSLTIWEGRKMIEAARKYNRIVQVGFENRSAPYAVTAREYIASGKLGKVQRIKVYKMLPGPKQLQLQPETQPPSGLDWDRFLGPAPERPRARVRNLGRVASSPAPAAGADGARRRRFSEHHSDEIELVAGISRKRAAAVVPKLAPVAQPRVAVGCHPQK